MNLKILKKKKDSEVIHLKKKGNFIYHTETNKKVAEIADGKIVFIKKLKEGSYSLNYDECKQPG